jgi:hypothetical protein
MDEGSTPSSSTKKKSAFIQVLFLYCSMPPSKKFNTIFHRFLHLIIYFIKPKQLLITGILVLTGLTESMSQAGPEFTPETPSFKHYQIHLQQPAYLIEYLRYEKSGEPVKGFLSPDGLKIFLEDYVKGERVSYRVLHQETEAEESTRSPCYIDPVIPPL